MKMLTKYSSYVAKTPLMMSIIEPEDIEISSRWNKFKVKPEMVFSLAACIFLSLLPGMVFAINCTSNNTGRTTYVDYHVPFLPGADIQVSALKNSPVGSVLWSQVIINPDTAMLGHMEKDCTAAIGEGKGLTYFYNMEGNLPSIVDTWNSKDVYDSGIPGVGLVVMGGNNGTSRYPYSFDYYMPSVWWANNIYNNRLRLYIYLIKTGDIPAGTWTIPISVPPVTMHADVKDNESGPEAGREYGGRLIMEPGSIHVVSGTCQTPDVNVPMGIHSVSNNMENTPWVDFAIELNNCPPMFGSYALPSGNLTPSFSWQGADKIVTGALTPNTLSVMFNPVYGFSEMPDGEACANISPVTDAASGVCLEIRNNLNVGVLDQGRLNLPVDSGLNLLDNIANYSIPLRARYVRTAGSSSMTAGRADSAVEFTINYY